MEEGEDEEEGEESQGIPDDYGSEADFDNFRDDYGTEHQNPTKSNK